MSGDQIKVSYAALDGLASGIKAQVSAIENELDTLKSQIQNLESLWQGAAGEGFQQTKTNWMSAAADLNSVLQRISIAVSQANEQYQQTESQNASAWS
jgi:early secretory antigenic target protein ESAT-6